MSSSIRVIAIALVRRGDAFLVSVHNDTVKGDQFCRALGGGVEWGESSRDTVVREFREELNVELENLRLLHVLENSFIHEGEPGHEVVFVYEADLVDRSLYGRTTLAAYEAAFDEPFTAHWLTLREIEEQGIRFVPEALKPLLVDSPEIALQSSDESPRENKVSSTLSPRHYSD